MREGLLPFESPVHAGSRAMGCGTALGVGALLLALAAAVACCGGSSSETPAPLEPIPANVHYDRASTTLPGELGTPAHSAEPAASTPAPAATPFHPSNVPRAPERE